jgi:hypothetical protein
MNKLALSLLAVLAAALPSLTVRADQPPAGASGPRPGTVEAMQCLAGIRQEPAECLKMFRGSAQVAATPWVYVSAAQAFERGRLVSSSFWGRASDSNMFDAKAMKGLPTREMDIFDVKFAHTEFTFYVSPADTEGKIRALTILLYKPHDPYQVSNCSGGHLCASGTP